jgi:hypothetical protein
MEIRVDDKYKGVPALIRYASILLNIRDEKRLSFYSEKVVSSANDLKFYAYPLNIINSNSSASVFKALKPYFKERNLEKNVLSLNQADSHFVDSIGVSDIEKNKQLILDALNNFYKNGNFEKLNRACYRFLKRMKGVNEYDMNDAVIRYVVSSICLRDFSQCYNIIESLQQEYTLFDYNIYLFFLYLVEGRYNDASRELLKIKTNISEDFNEYVSEEDLAFYFAFCLLFNFNIKDYKEVLSNNDIYVYKLYDKYRKYFEIVDAYYKSDYLRVNNEFNKKLIERIKADPFLSGFSDRIMLNFKEKILKEIMNFTSEISYQTISDLLVISKGAASEMVKNLIKNNRIDAVIDDIDEIVIMKKSNHMNDLLNESNKIMKKNLDDLIKFSYTNIEHKILPKIEGRNITKKPLERDRGDMDPRMIEMMMAGMG